MIFVVTATMVKQDISDSTVRGSTLVVLNATSETDAKGQFISSPDVSKRVLEGWRLGPVDALHVPPESVLSDADTLDYAKAKLTKGESSE